MQFYDLGFPLFYFVAEFGLPADVSAFALHERKKHMFGLINFLMFTLMAAAVVCPAWAAFRLRSVGFGLMAGSIVVYMILRPAFGGYVLRWLPAPDRISLGEQYALVYYAWCALSLVLFSAGAMLAYRLVSRRSRNV